MTTMSTEQCQPGLHDLATLRAVWDAVADGLVLSDAEGKLITVNQAYCSYDFAPDELVGHSFAVISQGEAREQAELPYRAIFEQGAPMVVESWVRSSAQTELVVEARASLIER